MFWLLLLFTDNAVGRCQLQPNSSVSRQEFAPLLRTNWRNKKEKENRNPRGRWLLHWSHEMGQWLNNSIHSLKCIQLSLFLLRSSSLSNPHSLSFFFFFDSRQKRKLCPVMYGKAKVWRHLRFWKIYRTVFLSHLCPSSRLLRWKEINLNCRLEMTVERMACLVCGC